MICTDVVVKIWGDVGMDGGSSTHVLTMETICIMEAKPVCRQGRQSRQGR
jgi:hypothetical protein